MPSETGVLQAVSSLAPNWIFGLPFSITAWPVARSIIGRPTSTRHWRHMPTGSIFGWIAENRNVDADLFGGVHDQGAFRNRDRVSVNRQ